jgi:hypothetical protein
MVVIAVGLHFAQDLPHGKEKGAFDFSSRAWSAAVAASNVPCSSTLSSMDRRPAKSQADHDTRRSASFVVYASL